VVEHADGWVLPLANATVVRVVVDDAVALECASSRGVLRLVLDAEFVFEVHGRRHDVDVDADPGSAAALLCLLHDHVRSATVARTGVLTVSFAGGASLYLDPPPTIAPWQLTGPDGSVAVAMPGQALAYMAASAVGH
jgi:hypothetical protein